MTNPWHPTQEQIEAVAKVWLEAELRCASVIDQMNAVISVLAPMVAEECAVIAERTGFHVMPDQLTQEVIQIAAAIRSRFNLPAK